MASTKKIIEAIDRLSARDRRLVLKHLEQLKTKSGAGPRKTRSEPNRAKPRPYGALLDLAGRAGTSG